MDTLKNLTLSILENEAAYGRRLADYLSSHEGSPFNIQLFLEHPAAADRLSCGDVTLVTSSLWQVYRNALKETPAVLLDEDGSRQDGASFSIYKYQSAENIYKSLISFCIDNSGKRLLGNSPLRRDFKADVLFVPAPGGDNSLKIQDMIREMAANKKILYISMEQVPSLTHYPPECRSREEGFSELIYYLKQYRENIGARICAIAAEGAYDCILPPALISETYELTGSEWKCFFDALKDETGYELLLLDYGTSVPPTDVLAQCSQITVVSSGSSLETELTENFRLILERVGGTELSNKIQIRKI